VNRIASAGVIAVLLSGSIRADDSIVIADELRTAFYEHAPRSLAAAMSKAVESWCSAAKSASPGNAAKPEAASWLCQGQELSYFRSVYINGEKGRHGLVCENSGTSTLKYFGIDLVADVVADGSCVPAEFDGAAYRLNLESVDNGGDA
jgi:hypothetical protein